MELRAGTARDRLAPVKPETDLAIVTSCYNYGAYLEEWALSILALERKPAMVGIFEHGSTDASAVQADAAAALLREGGLTVRLEHSADKLPFGVARNRAVALSAGCVWVMHLDADDMVMPHCLGDVAALADHADVVALGYERCGDLKAGPRQRRKLYRSSTGLGVLVNTTPSSGCSPYRRSLWERSPYAESMTGGWDTALWIGFGHLGARIVPTKRPCFWYRQHADSVFNTRRLASWPTAVVGNELQSRRRKDHGVSVLVPRSSEDGPERLAAWEFTKRRYKHFRPAWEIVEGISKSVPWQKGDALARALEQCRGRVAIVADADCLVDLDALDRAVAMVEKGEAAWVVPHTLVHRLHEAATKTRLKQPATVGTILPSGSELVRRPYVGFAAGGVFVVSRPMLQATGGIPKQFLGWGAEDEALAVIFDTLLGPHHRLPGDLIHLWHPPQPDKRGGHARNRVEFSRIRSLAGDPEALWRYLQDPRSLPRRSPETPEPGAPAWRRHAWAQRSAQFRNELAQSAQAQSNAAIARQRVRLERTMQPRHPNKMQDAAALETKGPPLQFANAAAAHLAERNRVGLEELQRHAPPGAPVTVDMVRAVLTTRRHLARLTEQKPRPAGATDDCGCGKKKAPAPTLLEDVVVAEALEQSPPFYELPSDFFVPPAAEEDGA